MIDTARGILAAVALLLIVLWLLVQLHVINCC